jgi:hypothetical protein
MPPVSPLLPVLAAIALGGPVDLLDAPDPTALREGFAPLGSVRFHAGRGEIEAMGEFNLRGGFLEYLACLPGAKRHEALIGLDCDPVDLKTGLLLLGLTEGRPPESEADLRAIPGDRVVIRLRYRATAPDGTRVLRDIRAEDVLINAPLEKEMARVGFVFTGSSFVEDFDAPREEGQPPPEVFAPRVLGELVAISHRPYAILDHPLELPYRDGDYFAYADLLPELSRDAPTPVAMVFRKPRPGEIDPTITRMELPPLDPEARGRSTPGGR